MTVVSPRAVLDVYRRNVNRGMGKLLGLLGADLEISASGCHVFDQEGRRYLNVGGYGVFLLGHCHPVVIAAVQEQLHRMPLATRLLVDPRLPRAAQALVAVAPPGLEYVLFTNSGTEAVEAALKIARVSGFRHTITTTGGYHGKTLGALSVSGRPRYRDPFMPLLGDVTFVSFADIGEMRSALAASAAATSVILEPVQAEGGVRVPPQGYLRAVKDLCSEFGAILIVDEIQTGLGRLGSWWGCTPEGVQPDILLVGKILSGGVVPVAAVVTRPELFEALNRDPLLHTSTFGGNPLACAAAEATLKVLHEERLIERAAQLGLVVQAAVRDALADLAQVRDVRGRGLLIGVEFDAGDSAVNFMTALLRRRVLASYSLHAGEVLRFTPPATLNDDDLRWFIEAVQEAAQDVAVTPCRKRL